MTLGSTRDFIFVLVFDYTLLNYNVELIFIIHYPPISSNGQDSQHANINSHWKYMVRRLISL